MTDESYCKYVSNRGICYNCDVYPTQIVSDTQVFNEIEYENIQNNNKVYVITSVLNHFVNKILPKLELNKIKIILVTGASVLGSPNEISKVHKLNYFDILLNSTSIIHWFTQNYDLQNISFKITPVPLGIDYHTLKNKNHRWGPKASPIEQEKQLIEISKLNNFNERKKRTFSFFHFRLFKRHNADRYLAIESLNKIKFNDFLNSRCNRIDTWKLCSNYKFIISPHGNGLDCHRTYEAMCLGSIPVVKSSSLDLLYKDMPIIILKDWDEISIDTLLKQSELYTKTSREKLTLNYWTNLINSYVPNTVYDYNVACCVCVRNCELQLPEFFKNLERLSKNFKNCYFVFVYDNCTDSSEKLLKQFQKTNLEKIILKNIENSSKYRTVRMAKARNVCLDVIYNELKDIDYHFMIDSDEVNIKPWNLNYIKKHLNNSSKWDSLSFNRKKYYDIWALMYNDIVHHCWGYNSYKFCKSIIVPYMRKEISTILNDLNDDELFACYSAFNGFAIYKTQKFKNIKYDGTWEKFRNLISDKDRLNTLNMFKELFKCPKLELYSKILPPESGVHCEHLYYHVSAIIKNKVKIRITKDIL